MTAEPRRPDRHAEPTQPQLPLHGTPAEPRSPRDEEWRLDEQTRQIGRRGVALARARLQRPAAAGGPGSRGGRGQAGRAA